MNAIAQKARDAAMQFEAKKNSLTQVQSGDWKLQFTVSPSDVPAGLLTAAMGTRYQVAIVEVDEHEQPVQQKPANHKLSQQAAMLCEDDRFQAFLKKTRSILWENYTRPTASCSDSDIAAACVRRICNVTSRSQFDTDAGPARNWRNLHAEYKAWQIT